MAIVMRWTDCDVLGEIDFPRVLPLNYDCYAWWPQIYF